MHNTTRYGEAEKSPRKESLGVIYRNWHPGPLGFQLLADSMTMLYTKAVLEGIEQVIAMGDTPPTIPAYSKSTLPSHGCKSDSNFDAALCETGEVVFSL